MQTILTRILLFLTTLLVAGCNTRAPISDAAISMDILRRDSALTDVRHARDTAIRWDLNASRTLPEKLDAIWLVGNFYSADRSISWVRLQPLADTASSGVARFLAGDGVPNNRVFWGCSGTGKWSLREDGVQGLVTLTFPSSQCTADGQIHRTYRFHNFTAAQGNAPDGANMVADVTDEVTQDAVLGYRFPSDWCVADMSSCPTPRP